VIAALLLHRHPDARRWLCEDPARLEVRVAFEELLARCPECRVHEERWNG
jgi:cytochrome P450